MFVKRTRIKKTFRSGWLLAGCLLLTSIVHVSSAKASNPAGTVADYGKLPLYFEANEGQADPAVDYLARGAGYTVLLKAAEAVISLRSQAEGPAATVHMRLAGGEPGPRVVGIKRLPSVSHYFAGSDPRQWRSGVPHYGRVRYQNVYPGVDVVYYGNRNRLEYDFIVAPEVDPSRITLDFQGVDRLELTEEGALAMHTGAGVLHQRPPVLYQLGPGETRQPVAGTYVLRGRHQVGFQVGAYDTERALVIDPVLEYSTYLGDSESAAAIAVDSAGHAYVAGQTRSASFPSSGLPFGGGRDAFVAKLNATGTGLIYSTFLGGSASDVGLGVRVDASGNAYVVGQASSIDFPTTAGAFQTSRSGNSDAFVAKLDGSGSLAYSTYLGGTGIELGHAIAIDSTGGATVVGETYSTDFPTTALAFQPGFGGGASDAFVTKLNGSGSALAYSTYLGGTEPDKGLAVAIDSLGHTYLTGVTRSTDFPLTSGALQPNHGGGVNDAFMAQLDNSGATLVGSTYLGGGGQDFGHGIAVDASWNVYVTGYTSSTDFHVTSGVVQGARANRNDAFVTALNASGALVYSTYLGGAQNDYGRAIAVTSDGQAYVTGNTFSADFPITVGAPQPTSPRLGDAFVTHLSPDGSLLVLSTYLGGSGTRDIGYGIAVDAAGSAYVTGYTISADFPVTAGALQDTRIGREEAFVTKVSP